MDAPEVLIRRIADGDKTAEQELVNRFWRPLYYIILRQSGDHALTQDVVQDSMLIVIEKVRSEKIEKPDAIAAFVRKVGENVLIAHYRQDKRRKTDSSDSLDVTWPDGKSNMANKISHQELVSIVQEALEELQVERDRVLLKDYYFYGKTKHQICAELELTPAHFDRVLHRAKNRLKQSLSIRFDVDLSKESLATLLSVGLLLLLSQPEQSDSTIAGHSVRDLPTTVHFDSRNSTINNQNDATTWPWGE